MEGKGRNGEPAAGASSFRGRTRVVPAPEVSHRSLVPLVAPVLVVIFFSGFSLRGLGWAAGGATAAVIVLVALSGVVAWRVVLPRRVFVDSSAGSLTHRGWFRTTTLARDAHLRAVRRVVMHPDGVQIPYLVVSGRGGRFRLDARVWGERATAQIGSFVPQGGGEVREVSARELEAEFPGLLPMWIAHPLRFALLGFLVLMGVIVLLCVAVLVLVD